MSLWRKSPLRVSRIIWPLTNLFFNRWLLFSVLAQFRINEMKSKLTWSSPWNVRCSKSGRPRRTWRCRRCERNRPSRRISESLLPDSDIPSSSTVSELKSRPVLRVPKSCSNHRERRPGVNFTNVLQAAFALVDPKSAKKTVKLSSFFALLGSASIKAARRMLVKLNPGWRSSDITSHIIE